jgi:L,D-transpeptidase-like protein
MRVSCTRIVAVAAVLGTLSFTPARAGLLITIDKAQQRMIVAKDDMPLYDWPVSTGQRGYDTPAGVYRPFRMEEDHFSREWDDAPMPHSIFFTQIGHAIHGSLDVKKLGRPASHGCVRLNPEHAAILFKLVRAEKMKNTRVVLTGSIPGGPGPMAAMVGTDPYAADEALGGWTRPSPVVADISETTASLTRVKQVERPRSRGSRVERRHYYEPPQRTFADILFHGIR